MSGFSYIVPPSLLLSPSARKRIQIAAHLSEIFTIGIAGLVYWTSELEDGYVIPHSDLLVTALMLGALVFAVLFIAMGAFLRKFDKSSDTKRAFWWALLVLTGPCGALAYCYAVYLPQTRPVPMTDEEKFSAATSD
jgi:uncharacterized membrane protein YfcA